MKNVMLEKRKDGLDVIRILATILVFTVHFFLRTNYYNVSLDSISLKLQSVIRNFCMSCVPLFIILTGFLNKKKKYDKKMFKGLLDILIIWFVYSTIEFIILNVINNGTLNFLTYLKELTSFKYAYSWYIKMYIGLYMMTPVINTAYENFDNKNRKILVFISIILTFIPNFIKVISNGILLLPDYWIGFYILTYYLIGKYISTNDINISKRNLLLLLVLNVFLIYSYQPFENIDYNSFLILTQTVLIFLLLYNINFKNKIIKKISEYVSGLTLDMYLVSSLIDFLIYKFYFNKFSLTNISQGRIILYAPIILLTSFFVSLVIASIRKLIIKVR